MLKKSTPIEDNNILKLLKQIEMELIKNEELRNENPNYKIVYHDDHGFYSPPFN